MNISIPEYAWQVIDRLNQNGFEAYVVGGCVRDVLLGRTPGDWDVCTNAKPDEILACFSDTDTVLTGIQHGTVTVLLEHNPIEVTTYRIDGVYSDCRHPDEVAFTGALKEDLARRDFTVNAMAYHPQKGVIDLYGGMEDIKNRVIRCVGDPLIRFSEDALRILRGLRFASVLGFSIDTDTLIAMEQKRGSVHSVAVERIYQELTKLVCGDFAKQTIESYGTVLSAILPVVPPVQLCTGFNELPAQPSVRYAALLLKTGGVFSYLSGLKAPGKVIADAVAIDEVTKNPIPSTLEQVRKSVYGYGWNSTEQGLLVAKSYGYNVTDGIGYLHEIQQKNLCCSLKGLAVTGNDLQQIGFSSGPELGKMLERLLFAVMEERVDNTPQALLQYADSNKKNL